jgi:hypothetical protein
MPATNQNDPQTTIELRLRTIRTLWISAVLSLLSFVVFTFIAGRSENMVPNQTVSLALLVGTMMAALVSFPLKSKFLRTAVEQQYLGMVQQAYVVAFTVTEVGGLLSLIDFFMTGNRYYFVGLIIAGCVQLLHFPRREHVINAAFKNTL